MATPSQTADAAGGGARHTSPLPSLTSQLTIRALLPKLSKLSKLPSLLPKTTIKAVSQRCFRHHRHLTTNSYNQPRKASTLHHPHTTRPSTFIQSSVVSNLLLRRRSWRHSFSQLPSPVRACSKMTSSFFTNRSYPHPPPCLVLSSSFYEVFVIFWLTLTP